MDREKIYSQLPVFLQHAACSVEGWRINRSRYGKKFRIIYHRVLDRGQWSDEQVLGFRDERLKAFLCHAAATVPYYRRLFQECAFNPNSIQGLEDLQSLPILTKETVKARMSEFISDVVPKREWLAVHTSGTTGAGLKFFTTYDAAREQWAVWWRYRKQQGIPWNAWCGYFGGRSIVPSNSSSEPYHRINFPGKQIIFSAYHLSETTFGDYLKVLNRRRPPWLHGYPSFLYNLAGLMLSHSATLDYRPRWVTTASENLLDHQVSQIHRAFGVMPCQHYGMTEAVANISQSADGKLLVDEDFAASEFVPTSEAGCFRVVGTNMSNPLMPLIRYDTGDIVKLSVTENAPRKRREVAFIDGRQEDFIVLLNGTRLGRLDHIFKDAINVRSAQIYQKKVGEIEVRIVRHLKFNDSDERALMDELRKRTGVFAHINIRYVDEIPLTRSGKHRFVISDLPEQRI